MGLSRNKVAVSEGAAGSPPFYGERARCGNATVRMFGRDSRKRLLFNFQGESLRVGVKSRRVHPFPFRTRKLSSAEPKILYRRRYGKIGRCRHSLEAVREDCLKRESREMGTYGGVAQLGEHLPCKQGVMGSNPIISTIEWFEATQLNGLIAQLVRAPA